MLSAISQLGMQTLLVREISRDKDRVSSYVSSSLLIGAFSSIIMLVVSNIAVMAIEKDQDLRLYIGLLTLGFTLSYVENTLTAAFMAFEKMRPVLIQRTAWNIIRIGGTIGFLLAGAGLLSVVVMWLMSTFISTLLGIYLYTKHIGSLRLRVERSITLELLRRCPVFLVTGISSTLSWQADLVLLRFMRDFTSVGLYVSAYRILDALFLPPQAYMSSAASQLSRFSKSHNSSYTDLGAILIRNVAIYAFICVGAIFVYPYLPGILLGSKFDAAAKLLKVLVLILLPWVFARISGYLLVMANRQNLDLASSVSATVVNIVLNVFLIPKYGNMGSAFATLISMCLFCALELFFARDLIRNLRIVHSLCISAALCIATGIITTLVVRKPLILIGISIILVLAAGMMLYMKRKTHIY